MAILNRHIKSEVYEAIVNSTTSFLGKYEEYDGILTFLSKVWNLKDMPSDDTRFKNAYEDTNQHIVNNSDWTIDYLFIERLKLLDGEENKFILFLESIVSPTVRKNKDEIIYYVSKINSIIQKSNYKLILNDYFEELPVYKFKTTSDLDDLPIDIIENKIPIYVKNHNGEIRYPYFSIKYDSWNDYGIRTLFNITFHKDEHNSTGLGRIKIMKRGSNKTIDTFSDHFTSLSNEYCSLGQEKKYYTSLKSLLGRDFHSFLLAMRDVAIFPKIHEQFEQDDIFKTSLVRFNEVERLTRTIRFEIEGFNPNEYFKFNYTYQPPYATNTIALNLDFEYNTDFEHRLYAIIGKNGTGKTKLLSSLAKSLSEQKPESFTPKKPVYGKIFTVSYSFFDRFEIPSSDASFNYVYCGLKKNNEEWKTEEDMLTGFYKSVKLIKDKGLESDWYQILKNFIDLEILNTIFKKNTTTRKEIITFNEDIFNEIKMTLSSGQSIILFLISEILSQIRYDSLILFDEPETHLHPNAISSLLNTLFNLVRRFESFCIIATHSPLIIQEIPARNIFILEREENTAFIRELERESLGENLTTITQDIFGNREVPKHFVSLIKELILKEKSYSEIVNIIESDQLPITSNMRLYIKSLLLN